VTNLAAIGRHTTADFYGCRREVLNDMEQLQNLVLLAVNAANLKMLSFQSYQFAPEGITVLALLTDGHLGIHTYPEVGFAAVDIFTCDSQSLPEKALTAIKRSLVPEKTKNTLIKRGDFGSERDMKPRTKTNSGPIRRVKDTGSKVMKFLSRQ
jgi:S-adenosylmethionine decarboxylase